MATDKALAYYQRLNDPGTRERFLIEYLPLVKYIAGRLAIGLPQSVEINDLINAGVIGLIEAVNNFDPSQGVKLETFAASRIRGAMVDELRRMDWAPRSLRAKSKQIERAIAKLENQLGRVPTDEELAKSLEISPEELAKRMDEVKATTLLSLDEFEESRGLAYGGDVTKRVAVADTINSDLGENGLSRLEREELKKYLAELISKLPEQQRLVVVLHYYEELTLKEIGKAMQISESRVSQLHTRAILGLRAKLKSWMSAGSVWKG